MSSVYIFDSDGYDAVPVGAAFTSPAKAQRYRELNGPHQDLVLSEILLDPEPPVECPEGKLPYCAHCCVIDGVLLTRPERVPLLTSLGVLFPRIRPFLDGVVSSPSPYRDPRWTPCVDIWVWAENSQEAEIQARKLFPEVSESDAAKSKLQHWALNFHAEKHGFRHTWEQIWEDVSLLPDLVCLDSENRVVGRVVYRRGLGIPRILNPETGSEEDLEEQSEFLPDTALQVLLARLYPEEQ
jgi:hypothetical protein